MKAYEHTKRIIYKFEDYHFIKKKHINWWEDECMNGISKKTSRQNAKKEIEMEVARMDEELVSKTSKTIF